MYIILFYLKKKKLDYIQAGKKYKRIPTLNEDYRRVSLHYILL